MYSGRTSDPLIRNQCLIDFCLFVIELVGSIPWARKDLMLVW